MVIGITPCLDILHAHNTGSLVGCRIRYSSPSTIGGHTYTSHTATMHGSITTVVIEPFLEFLTSLGGIGGPQAETVGGTIPHGTEPLVVALHPTIVRVIMRLCSKESAIGTSPIRRNIRDTIALGHTLSGTGLICHQPGKMRGVLVLWQRGVQVAIAVYLMRKLIAYSCCRATGTAILIEDGREVLVLTIIHIRWQLRLCLTCLTTGHIISGLCLGSDIVLQVGKDTTVNLYYLAVWQDIVFYLGVAAHGVGHAGYEE